MPHRQRFGTNGARLVINGLRVLREQGPTAFVRGIGDWIRDRRAARRFVGKLVLVDTSSARALNARPPDANREPTVSIVIVVWNALPYAKACLESVMSAASEHTFEVIAVDNGSERDVRDWLEVQAELHPELGYVRLPSNVGFARGSNLGARIGNGRYVVLLNSDTIVTDGWLDNLVGALERDETLGLVSPVTNYVGEGDQIDDAAQALRPEDAAGYARSISRRAEIIRAPERVAFFCVVLRRDLFDRLNGLDEGYGIGNYEDEDFCFRMQLLGYRIGVVTNSFVYHHGSKTFEHNEVDHSEWMTRNHIRYFSKIEQTCTRFPTTRAMADRTDNPAVSVIVRTRNRPDDLKVALNSLMWQTYDQFEVVVVNDGGADVEELLEPYARELPLRYIVNDTAHGPARAANDGVEVASGRQITFLDDDDVLYPFHLASLTHAAERTTASSFVYSNYVNSLVRGRGASATVVDRTRVPRWSFDRNELLVQNRPPVHTWLLPRSLFEQHGGFDTSFAILKDWDFLLRVTEDAPLLGIARESCEYRIYLDLQNSVAGDRQRVLDELHEIYRRHPAADEDVDVARKLTVAEVEGQVVTAHALRSDVERGTLTQEEAARLYIAKVFGL